jgi:RNA polymerase sigma factor (sigma-70 family)
MSADGPKWLGELLAGMIPSLVVYLLKYGHARTKEVAEDIVQDSIVVFQLARGKGKFADINETNWSSEDKSNTVYAWLAQTARLIALAENRNETKRRRREGQYSRGRGQAADELNVDLTMHDVQRALSKCKPEQIALLLQYYCARMSIADIAGELGVPKGTVKRRLWSARKRFRSSLGDASDDIQDTS